MFKKIFRTQSGFTLVEIMIVTNIIGILSVIAVQSGLSYMERAKQKATQDSLRVLRQAIVMYNLDTGHFPETPVLIMEAGVLATPPSWGAGVAYTGGMAPSPEMYGYIKRIPMNLMNSPYQAAPLNAFICFYDAPDTSFTFDYPLIDSWDGWHYYYKINGEEVGLLYAPKKGTDYQGESFSLW